MTKRILVVEDQEDLRGILRDLLTGSGYEIAEAANGRDGVAKAKSETPDLILVDIQLPILGHLSVVHAADTPTHPSRHPREYFRRADSSRRSPAVR